MDMEKEEEKESRLDIPELDLLEAELEREQYKSRYGRESGE